MSDPTPGGRSVRISLDASGEGGLLARGHRCVPVARSCKRGSILHAGAEFIAIGEEQGRRMAGILDGADLPPLLATVVKPWVTAVKTGTLGMHDVVASAASSTAASVKRRVVVWPGLDMAIAAAVEASVAFAEALAKRGAATTKLRSEALASREVVIEHLRTAAPSEDTRALGLGW
jgi:hypothetical protein